MKPRYKNFSLHECAAALEKLMPKLPPGSAFFQKWTCAGCGERVTGNTPNKLFMAGHCETCGHVTDILIDGCNYSVHMAAGGLASMPGKGNA